MCAVDEILQLVVGEARRANAWRSSINSRASAKPEPEPKEKERRQVKAGARTLLQTLKEEKLVLDWTKKKQVRGAVRQAIEVTLGRELPEAYDEGLFNQKCDTLYRHIFDAYHSGREGIYAAA